MAVGAPSAAPASLVVSAQSVGPAPAVAEAAPRFVFLFIGDGMGFEQLRLAEGCRAAAAVKAPGPGAKAASGELLFRRFPVRAAITTHAANAAITDSAASGTALATGHKTKNGSLGIASDGKTPLDSVAVVARRRGMRVALLSSVSLDHATPAAFYAHQAERGDYAAIAEELVTSGFDYFGGGGLAAALGITDEAESPWAELARRGVSVARNAAALRTLGSLPAFASSPVLDGQAAMPYELDRPAGAPRLADFTRQAIELLGTERGFFMMVEGGRIDWAGHANDAAAVATETLEFEAAVAVARDFAARFPAQTSIVVTADHETGGLKIAASPSVAGLAALSAQGMSGAAFDAALGAEFSSRPQATLPELTPLLERMLGGPLTTEFGAELSPALARSRQRRAALAVPAPIIHDRREPLVAAVLNGIARRAGLSFASQDHTATPVPLFAEGLGEERFTTVVDNAEVGRALIELVAGTTP